MILTTVLCGVAGVVFGFICGYFVAIITARFNTKEEPTGYAEWKGAAEWVAKSKQWVAKSKHKKDVY